MKSGKDLFQIWMKEESDLIQSTARSYGELICLQEFIRNIHAIKTSTSTKTQEMLSKLAVLYALHSIQRDLAWFMAEGIFPQRSYSKFNCAYDSAVNAVAPIAMDAISCFNIPEEMLHSPIAQDWIKYNTFDNQGNIFFILT